MKKSTNTLIGKLALIALMFASAFGITMNPETAYANNEIHGRVARKISDLKQQAVFSREYAVFSVAQSNSAETLRATVSKFTLLDLKQGASEIMTSKPEYLKLAVPVENGSRNLTLLLYKVNISPNGFNLLCSDGLMHTPDNSIVHYRGTIENDDNSIVALSFSSNEIMGMVSNNNGNYVIGKIENNSEGLYMIYNDRDMVQPFNFECATNTSVPQGYSQKNSPPGTLSANCVNWYWETDYDIYAGKGSSVANVNSYIQGIFNEVSTLYDNDGMNITLLTVFIWSTVDPYTGPSTSNYLSQFGTNRTSFNGDLANLLGYGGGGGVAWLDGFCSSTSHKMAYSGISSSFNTVPTYSWTVEVVAHEEGHLFGSHHTHDCVWNGNNTKIDACGDSEGYTSGSCSWPNPALPPGGGTIMSYCHLTSVGINFNLGFGPQPTDVMLTNEETSSCLSACSGCNPPSQPGTISGSTGVCQSASQTYSISTVSGATGYTWTLPSGWTGSSTTTSITVTAGSAGGNITVKANNACGSSAVRSLAVSILAVPAQPGTISGSAAVCPGTSQTYSISTVSGATSYTWTLPSGWTGSSTSTSITATAGSAGGNITVKANNSCGSSAVRTLAVSIATVPAQPGTIAGSAGTTVRVCPGDARTYSVAPVAGLSYNWIVPTGAAITSGQGTNVIQVTYNTNFISAGTIYVAASNSCGAGPSSSLLVQRRTPAKPGPISGQASVCNGSTTVYSIQAVGTADYYVWTIPAGAVIQGPQTGTSISILWGATGGNIKVKTHNNCGESGQRWFAVNVTCRQPGVSNAEELKAEVFPNPTSGKVTVKFSSDNESLCTISVSDLTGRILKSEKYTSVVGDNVRILDLSGFTKGIYFVCIGNGKESQVVRIGVE
jgi:PKD domain-containing protein/metallopeptidase family M12-like protein/type IX secretion system substrate protein